MFNPRQIVLTTPVSLHFDTALSEELAPKAASDSSETPRIVVTQCKSGDAATKDNKQAKVLLSASDIGVLDGETVKTETPTNASSSKDQSKEENGLELKVEQPAIGELNCPCPPRQLTNNELKQIEIKDYKFSPYETPTERPTRPTSNRETVRKVSKNEIRRKDSPRTKSASPLRSRYKHY